jgi:serine/threonine-protein kinase HipA
MSEPVQVHVDIDSETVRVGSVFFHRRRRSLATTFTYDPSWLADRRSFALDPSLDLATGSHHVDGLPGAFGDGAPDRWGRNLIARRARAIALQVGGMAPSLSDADFLLGVSDLTRQGALRFRVEDGGPFLAPDHEVPKLIELPRLLHAAAEVSSGSEDDFEAVKALLDAGSGSLGGARPKATVREDDGRLLIAKFPHHHDDWAIGAWEKTALDLAERAGVVVPARRLVPLGPSPTLLLDRFDRTADGRRIPYISALTLLSGRDGDSFDYEDIAAQLEEFAAGDAAEFRALFRRVVVSVALHNTDDHLRNTGFLHLRDGWRLSPAFDVNPNPDRSERRQTTIGGAESADDEPEGLMRLAPWCHLGLDEARQVITEVLEATADWKRVAEQNNAPRVEINRFADILDGQRAALTAVTVAMHTPTAPTRPRPSSTHPTDAPQPRAPRGTPDGGRFA